MSTLGEVVSDLIEGVFKRIVDLLIAFLVILPFAIYGFWKAIETIIW